MITDKEALQAIRIIALYCDAQEGPCRESCVIRGYCEVMEDREVPIPWLMDELEEGVNNV